MQPLHTPAHAQHTPVGWSFPTLTVPTPPPARGGGVTGGGASAGTVARVRWGRLLPTFAGIALLAFGIWSITANPQAGAARAAGGDASPAKTEIDLARAARSDAGAPAADIAMNPPTTPRAAAPTAAPRVATRRSSTVRGAAAQRRAVPARRTTRRAGMAGAAAMAAAPRANAAPTTVTGGGTAGTGQLPVTGLETWIAGILGALLLGVGIVVHVNAVRLAATAMLYRRGILLRPVDCARLAQRRGLPRLRVALSDALHRLLEEPGSGDFVSARLAR